MGRIGLVLKNIAFLFPVYIILIVSAILSSMAAAKLGKFTDQSEAIQNTRKYIGWSTAILWILFVGSLLFYFTIGLFIIPWLVSIPYLYGGVMIMFAIINVVLSGYFFYAANSIANSQDYKDGSADAKSAFNYCLSVGLMMLFAGIFMIGFSIWSIRAYYRGGGFAGDIALAAEIAPVVVPEAAPFLVAAKALGPKLTPEQEEAQKARGATATQLLALAKQLGGPKPTAGEEAAQAQGAAAKAAQLLALGKQLGGKS